MKTLLSHSKGMLRDFGSLLFPQICAACSATLHPYEKGLCTHCLITLPRTDYHLHDDNPVMLRFRGRIHLAAAAAFFTFEKEGRVQQLLHAVKYQGREDAAVQAGKIFGQALRTSPLFHDVTKIIPVPLHRDKLQQRGYNQAEAFARGLAGAMDVLLDTRTLQRVTATSTQTRKSRFERWKNVEEVFAAGDTTALEDQHVLLVDDVVTTGATLEACAQRLSRVPGIRISIAAMATAQS